MIHGFATLPQPSRRLISQSRQPNNLELRQEIEQLNREVREIKFLLAQLIEIIQSRPIEPPRASTTNLSINSSQF